MISEGKYALNSAKQYNMLQSFEESLSCSIRKNDMEL